MLWRWLELGDTYKKHIVIIKTVLGKLSRKIKLFFTVAKWRVDASWGFKGLLFQKWVIPNTKGDDVTSYSLCQYSTNTFDLLCPVIHCAPVSPIWKTTKPKDQLVLSVIIGLCLYPVIMLFNYMPTSVFTGGNTTHRPNVGPPSTTAAQHLVGLPCIPL